MIRNGVRLRAAFLAFALLCAIGRAQAQEPSVKAASWSQDISTILPPIRGLNFDDPRADISDRGPVSPELFSEEGISLIAAALAWLGTPYQLGGFSKAGVDCSGFLYNVLALTVPELKPFPRRSDGFASVGTEASTIEPGDILLFAYEKAIYHVGLALSSSTFIHSASEGARTGVIISSLREGNWSARLYGVRRLRQ